MLEQLWRHPLPFLGSIFPPPNASEVDVGVGPREKGTQAPSRSPPTRPAPPPGYAEPLKSVPPEKFNQTVIPKGYRCPWQDVISYRDYQSDGRSHTPSPAEYRNFNK